MMMRWLGWWSTKGKERKIPSNNGSAVPLKTLSESSNAAPRLYECRCRDALGMHDGEDGPCMACRCPEYRQYENPDTHVMRGASW